VRSSNWSGSTVCLALAAAAIVFALAAGGALGSNASGPGVAIDFASSGYSIHRTSAIAGWEQPGFSESAADWAPATAPFGNNVSGCSFPTATTSFGSLETIFLRKPFTLPDNAFGLHIAGTIDNAVDFWVNGHSEGHVHSGSCVTGAININVPNADLIRGSGNPDVPDDGQLIAVKAVGENAGSPSFFDMKATYGTINFTVQPIETEKGSPISPAPQVTITPPAGGPAIPDGTGVDISLETISGTGHLSGTTHATTVGGVATFSNLVVSDPGEYRLVAASQGAKTPSNGFLIANEIAPCTGSCDAQGSVPNNTAVDASATNAAGNLAVSVFGGTAPPGGVCAGFVPQGTGSFVNILPRGATLPDFVITWTLDKSLVRKSGNPGASKYNICLGAEDLNHPDGTGVTPWKTKSGGNAVGVPDANLGVTLFWGILPDCPKKGRPAGPCVLHRNKTNAGDVVVTIFKPAPWDATMHGG
jgi:hypothetical protein